MTVFFFISSLFLLLCAHIVKIERQSQFVEIYENPPKLIFSQALSATFLLNLVLPLKLGNIFRIFYPRRHLQNGATFSLATIVIDIILDFITVFAIYAALFAFGWDVKENFIFFLSVICLLIAVILISFILKKFIKLAIYHLAGLFNENLRLKILKTSWFSITAFKDMFRRINKLKLLFYTALSCALYLGSFYCFSRFLINSGIQMSFLNIVDFMYGSSNLKNPTIVTILNQTGKNGLLSFLAYMIIPILIVFIYPLIFRFIPKKNKQRHYINLLPQVSAHDKLIFLLEYFTAKKSEYLKSYLELNKDIAIIQDYSAGSNARTMLCSKDDKTFYRKVSFGSDAKKLEEQIEWLTDHKNRLPLAPVENPYTKEGICAYDMPYVDDAVSCFNYVHTMPFENSWQNIKAVLDDIYTCLHLPTSANADLEALNKYIETKVIANIESIKAGKYIKPLLKYEYIYINGVKYHNLPYFEKYLTKNRLLKIFEDDKIASIHGDLTIENIICLKKSEDDEKPYYLIDPNTGNVHNSPYLDYGKLLQSIHGGYEFLMNTKSLTYHNDTINFLFTKSNTYFKLFNQYNSYLLERFGNKGLKSIYYHEIIHWLRLMPYKINKIEEKSLIFYAGMIMVMSDVEERFEKNEAGNI